jgi:hypothetical protein
MQAITPEARLQAVLLMYRKGTLSLSKVIHVLSPFKGAIDALCLARNLATRSGDTCTLLVRKNDGRRFLVDSEANPDTLWVWDIG